MCSQMFDGSGQRGNASAGEAVGAIVGDQTQDERGAVGFEGEVWSGVHENKEG